MFDFLKDLFPSSESSIREGFDDEPEVSSVQKQLASGSKFPNERPNALPSYNEKALAEDIPALEDAYRAGRIGYNELEKSGYFDIQDKLDKQSNLKREQDLNKVLKDNKLDISVKIGDEGQFEYKTGPDSSISDLLKVVGNVGKQDFKKVFSSLNKISEKQEAEQEKNLNRLGREVEEGSKRKVSDLSFPMSSLLNQPDPRNLSFFYNPKTGRVEPTANRGNIVSTNTGGSIEDKTAEAEAPKPRPTSLAEYFQDERTYPAASFQPNQYLAALLQRINPSESTESINQRLGYVANQPARPASEFEVNLTPPKSVQELEREMALYRHDYEDTMTPQAQNELRLLQRQLDDAYRMQEFENVDSKDLAPLLTRINYS
tara:strand:+ start:43 stop:1164 length:1122 start_codon:yes stop_codon:yes gene_type:complete